MTRAEHIVNQLLEEYNFGDYDDHASRAGGPNDPHRQVTMNIDTHKLDYSGQRPVPGEGGGPYANDPEIAELRKSIRQIQAEPSFTERGKLERIHALFSRYFVKYYGRPETSTPDDGQYYQMYDKLFNEIVDLRDSGEAEPKAHPRFSLKFGDSTGGA